MKETITETAQEIVEKTMELPEKIVEAITEEEEEKEHTISESIKEAAAAPINSAKHYAYKKIEDATKQMQEALPAIEKSGYVLHSMDIDIGVLPKIVSRFSIGQQVSDEEKERVLEENKRNRFTYLLLSSLIKASEIKEYIKLGEMKFHEIEVHASSTPKIKLRFAKIL